MNTTKKPLLLISLILASFILIALITGVRSKSLTSVDNSAAESLPTSNPTQALTLSTATYYASDDAKVYFASPTRNYGSSDTISSNKTGPIESYLRFKVNDILQNANIYEASLTLFCSNGSSDGPKLMQISPNYSNLPPNTWTEWNEKGLTWNNRPAILGTFSDVGEVKDNTWVKYDVSWYVKSKRNYEYVFGLIPDSKDGVTCASDESRNRPMLQIIKSSIIPVTPTPVASPSSAVCLPPPLTCPNGVIIGDPLPGSTCPVYSCNTTPSPTALSCTTPPVCSGSLLVGDPGQGSLCPVYTCSTTP